MFKRVFKHGFWIIAILVLAAVSFFSIFSKEEGDTKVITTNKDLVNIYFFYGKTCPHCTEEEKLLSKIADEKKANIYYYEVFFDESNQNKYKQVADSFNIQSSSVPFTIIGDKTWIGYTSEEKPGKEFKDRIEYCNQNTCKDTVKKLLDIPENPKTEEKVVTDARLNGNMIWMLVFLMTAFVINMKNRRKLLTFGGSALFIIVLAYVIWELSFLASYSGKINLMMSVLALILSYSNLNKYIILESKNRLHLIDGIIMAILAVCLYWTGIRVLF